MEKIKFQELIKNIEKNRKSLILEKEKREKIRRERKKKFSKKVEINVDIFDDRVEYFFGDILFIFDPEGYDLFEEKFNTFRSKIIVYKGKKDNSEGYLSKLIPGLHKPLGFHRWLMSEEIEKFAKENNISNTKEIHVHHIDGNTTNNRKENLQVMTKKTHRKLHYKSSKTSFKYQ